MYSGSTEGALWGKEGVKGAALSGVGWFLEKVCSTSCPPHPEAYKESEEKSFREPNLIHFHSHTLSHIYLFSLSLSFFRTKPLLFKMLSIFAQTAQTSASEPQSSPAGQGRDNGSPIGYSSCVVA